MCYDCDSQNNMTSLLSRKISGASWIFNRSLLSNLTVVYSKLYNSPCTKNVMASCFERKIIFLGNKDFNWRLKRDFNVELLDLMN